MARKRLVERKIVPPFTIELPEFYSLLKTVAGSGKELASLKPSSDWNGNLTLAEAIACLENGWLDAPPIPLVTIPNAPSFIPDIDYNYDVTGNSLDVATYITGIPEHWFAPEFTNRPSDTIVKLSIEVGGSWKVEPHELRNRGQAVIALVNSLEIAGLSVELVLVSSWISAAGITNTMLLPVKRAGQPLDMNRLQFMLISPAFYRRCIFAMHEHVQNKSMFECNSFSRTYAPAGYTHINYAEGLHATLEGAMSWAQYFGRGIVASATPALV
jgi:hypothetical protein